MARLPYIRSEDIPVAYSDIAAREINIFRLAANNLDAARALRLLGHYIRHDSILDHRLREMAVVQVGYLSGCAYEFYHHVKIGFQFGLSDTDVQAIIAETEGNPSALNETEKAVLRMARQMTAQISVDTQTFNCVAAALSSAALIDLGLTISHYNGVVRFLSCFEVDLEPGYEELVRKYPLPARRLQ